MLGVSDGAALNDGCSLGCCDTDGESLGTILNDGIKDGTSEGAADTLGIADRLGPSDGAELRTQTQQASYASMPVVPVAPQNASGFASIWVQPIGGFSLKSHPDRFEHADGAGEYIAGVIDG